MSAITQERLLQVLLAPQISEKATFIADKNEQVVFKVSSDATKPEVKAAVESLFKVEVKSVQILNVKGKEDGAQKIIERLEKEFKAEGCDIESVQKMDTRPFSYTAGKLDSGFFVNFVFTGPTDALPKLQARFKLDEDVYRQQYGRLAAKKKSA